MMSFLELYNFLRQHPIARGILTVIAVATAFITGAFFNLDIGFVPIIHKGDMLILMSFYGSILTLALRFLSAGVEMTAVMLKGISEFAANAEGKPPATETISPAEDEREAFSQPVQIAIFLIALAIALGLAFVLLYVLPRTQWFSRFPSAYYCLVSSLGFAVFALAMTPGARAARDQRLQIVKSRFTRAHLKIMELSLAPLITCTLLFAAGCAGSFYVDLLREIGPRVSISMEDGPDRDATIAFPAGDGLIVFYDWEDGTHYIPLSSIKSITGKSTFPLRFPERQ